jgi:hypothetical protein
MSGQSDARGYVNARDNLETYRRVVEDLKAGRPLADIPRVTPEERRQALAAAAALELEEPDDFGPDGYDLGGEG